jgi:hypothetical protein
MALAALVVRAPTWPPPQMIRDLEALLLSQGDASMQECLQMAMLKLLSSLPAVISDRSISVSVRMACTPPTLHG